MEVTGGPNTPLARVAPTPARVGEEGTAGRPWFWWVKRAQLEGPGWWVKRAHLEGPGLGEQLLCLSNFFSDLESLGGGQYKSLFLVECCTVTGLDLCTCLHLVCLWHSRLLYIEPLVAAPKVC